MSSRVLIVGKTRMGNGICVGALDAETGESLRLLPPGGFCHGPDTGFDVGDFWFVDLTPVPRSKIDPPHVEDHYERNASYHYTTSAVADEIWALVMPTEGGREELFEGTLVFRRNGSAFVSRDAVPSHSTEFWVAPRSMRVETYGEKVYYRFANRQFKTPYVGVAEPIDQIPAGTLVRLSLARWWCSPSYPEDGEVCSLQLSGWFL
jgi:hypothetical protein